MALAPTKGYQRRGLRARRVAVADVELDRFLGIISDGDTDVIEACLLGESPLKALSQRADPARSPDVSDDQVPRYVHRTYPHNLASILVEGLEPRDTTDYHYKSLRNAADFKNCGVQAVYLTRPGDCEWDCSGRTVALEVDLTGLRIECDPEVGHAVRCRDHIPPERIRVRDAACGGNA